MSRKAEKTSVPGIYKRENRYVVVYYLNGKQRREYVRTMKEARALKAGRVADRDRGELHEERQIAFRAYAEEWIENYRGHGRNGFTEETRADYRRDLERYAYPYLCERLPGRTVSKITPRDIDRWIGWLCDEDEQRRRLAAERGVALADLKASGRLADATVRRIVSPVRACLATARREGLIRTNPADGAVLPHREQIEGVGEPDAGTQAFSREQLDAVLRVVHPRHRTLLHTLAGSGLRWGEVAALRRGDLALDGSRPHIRVRRALTKGGRFKPPKSRHGVRDVPLSPALVRVLRAHLSALPPGEADALAFPSRAGTPLSYPNALRRILRPAAEEAGAPWAGFHTFRHTFASLHLARGTNIVTLSRILGHHSPEFTLSRYAHRIPGDDPVALDVDAELARGSINGSTEEAVSDVNEPEPVAVEPPSESQIAHHTALQG